MSDVSHYTAPEELSVIEDGLVDVVLEAQTKRLSVSSDFARQHAAMVGMAASMGLITTKIHLNVFGRHWTPTVLGLRMLNEVELNGDDA